jgi:hypothetical protein
MAAPQQAQTVEAIRCYADLRPTAVAAGGNTPRVLFGPALAADDENPSESSISLDGLPFGEALAGLLELACAEETRAIVASEVFGVWINRGCPVASLQFSACWQGRRALVSHTYGLAPDAAPPAWLDLPTWWHGRSRPVPLRFLAGPQADRDRSAHHLVR